MKMPALKHTHSTPVMPAAVLCSFDFLRMAAIASALTVGAGRLA